MRRLALLIGVLGLLANSFECYGAWMMSKEARDCCNSGHCSPANHDSCCKAAPSGSSHAFVSQDKADVSPTILAVAAVSTFVVRDASAPVRERAFAGSDIPPPLRFTSANLPLLI